MSKQLHSSEPFTPFYKEPLVLMLIAIPFASIIWGGVMLKLAFSDKDTLVSDSYYKEGVSYTENKELDGKAKTLGLAAELLFNADEVQLTLTGNLADEPNSLQLRLIHPTLEDQDITVFMQRLSAGHYAGVMEHEVEGKRHIWLQSPEQHWRLRTTAGISSAKAIIISAQ